MGRVGALEDAPDGHGWRVGDVHDGKNYLSSRRRRLPALLACARRHQCHSRGEGGAVN